MHRTLNSNPEATQGAEWNNSVSMVKACVDSQAMETLLIVIPKFDGEAQNFAVWCNKMELTQPAFDEDLFLKVVEIKIRDLIIIVYYRFRGEHDEYGWPILMHSKFQQLNQGTSNFTKHHAEIYQLMRDVGESLETTSGLLKSGYITSLSNDKFHLKLTRIVAKNND